MGIFDKAKDLAGNADELIDKAKDVVEEHGDKLPGGLGDKAKDLLNKADEAADKLPGDRTDEAADKLPGQKAENTADPTAP